MHDIKCYTRIPANIATNIRLRTPSPPQDFEILF